MRPVYLLGAFVPIAGVLDIADVSPVLVFATSALAMSSTGQADVVNVVNAVNAAELTLDTVVAVRDKVIAAYQSIMQMPI